MTSLIGSRDLPELADCDSWSDDSWSIEVAVTDVAVTAETADRAERAVEWDLADVAVAVVADVTEVVVVAEVVADPNEVSEAKSEGSAPFTTSPLTEVKPEFRPEIP